MTSNEIEGGEDKNSADSLPLATQPERGQDDLLGRTTSGFSWQMSSALTKFGLQFTVGVVLARLLEPSDFGLVGMAMIVIAFGQIFVDLGFAPSIIQYPRITDRHIRLAFTVSVFSGLLLTGLVFLGAPLLATFLRDPAVGPVLQVSSVTFVFSSFGNISDALLTRELQFRKRFFVDTVGFGIGYGAVAIALALGGMGVWSLVFGALVQNLLTTVLSYAATRHPVRLLLSRAEYNDLANFGFGVSLQSLLNYFARQGDYLVVGRVLGSSELGLYSRGYQLMNLPFNYFVRVVATVMFPAASRIQHDFERSRRVYAQTLGITSFIMMPIMLLIVVLVPEIVLVIYGEKWAGTIPVLQILSLFGVFRAGYHIVAPFIMARKHIVSLIVSQVVYGVCVIGGSWYAAPRWGIVGVSWAVGFSILIMFLLLIVIGNRLMQLSLRAYAKTQLAGVSMAALVVSAAWLAKLTMYSMGLSPVSVLFGALFSALLAILLGLLVSPISVFGDSVRIILRLMRRIVPENRQAFIHRLFSRYDTYQSSVQMQ